MSFGRSIGICLRRWATVTGRAPRSEYWPFAAFVAALAVPGYLALGVAAGRAVALAALIGLAALFLGVASLAATVRRLHDRDISGRWVVLVVALGFLDLAINTGGTAGGFGLVIKLAGAIGAVALVAQTLMRGSAGANAFGPDPLAGARAASTRRRSPPDATQSSEEWTGCRMRRTRAGAGCRAASAPSRRGLMREPVISISSNGPGPAAGVGRGMERWDMAASPIASPPLCSRPRDAGVSRA